MPYRVELVRAAKLDLKALRKAEQVMVLDRIEAHLVHEPTRQSRSRIKTLRPGTFPPYRRRVDEFRIYYDVDEAEQIVVVYGVVRKSDSTAWLLQATEEHHRGEPP